MSISKEKIARNEEKIVAAARELFLKNGYGQTSMDDIAKSACATKQTIYRYYPSKLDLFKAVLDSMGEGRGGYVFGRSGLLEELIKYGEDFMKAHFDRERLELYRMTLAESGREELGSIFREKAQRVRRRPLVDFLKERVAVSEPDYYAEIFNSMLLVFRPQVLMGLRDVPDSYERRKHAEVTAEIFVNGVLGL